MHIHIIGICGTFMGGVAALAREAGHKVTGCDANVYPPMSDQLRLLGIDLIEGYEIDQLALKPDMYVVGNVVKRGNPLMEAILNQALPYTSGPQWLSEHILAGRHVLGIAGTHGKTTTTSMLAWILEKNGLAPGFLVGGVPQNFGVSARLGTLKLASNSGAPGNPFVIEADEYDTAFFDKRSKFVHYHARTTILNNLEYDHADIFPDLHAIETQFHHLVRTIPSQGRVIVNGMQESLQRVMQRGCWSDLAWFGNHKEQMLSKDKHPQWTFDGVAEHFTIYKNEKDVGCVQWALQGEHNQLNALSAIIAAEHMGIAPQAAAAALADFENVKRRMEVKGIVGDVTVYDDFAHHPTAIRTTIDGLRHKLSLDHAKAGKKETPRILAVLEPRSNTMKLGTMSSQLPWALEGADKIYCYSKELDWDAGAALIPLGNRAQVFSDLEQLVASVTTEAHTGDNILCMSNGGFGGVHGKLLEALKQKF